MKIENINFPTFDDNLGSLTVYEVFKNIPFEIKRIFTVKAKKNEIRGNHAHKECSQILICVNGKIEVECKDGLSHNSYLLESKSQGILIPPGIWASEKYLVENSILMVICDQEYTQTDYIKRWSEFKKFKKI